MLPSVTSVERGQDDAGGHPLRCLAAAEVGQPQAEQRQHGRLPK
jgi:hypothetical protein